MELLEHKKPNIVILPLSKRKIILFNKIKFEILQPHFTLKSIKKIFIKQPKLLLKLNIFGPPSTIIYKKCDLSYDKSLRYLVDIEFYIKLLEKFKYKNVYFAPSYYSLISLQNNPISITKSLKIDKFKIRIKEENYILRKFNLKFNFLERLFLIYIFLILKLISIIKTKIIFSRL